MGSRGLGAAGLRGRGAVGHRGCWAAKVRGCNTVGFQDCGAAGMRGCWAAGLGDWGAAGLRGFGAAGLQGCGVSQHSLSVGRDARTFEYLRDLCLMKTSMLVFQHLLVCIRRTCIPISQQNFVNLYASIKSRDPMK